MRRRNKWANQHLFAPQRQGDRFPAGANQCPDIGVRQITTVTALDTVELQFHLDARGQSRQSNLHCTGFLFGTVSAAKTEVFHSHGPGEIRGATRVILRHDGGQLSFAEVTLRTKLLEIADKCLVHRTLEQASAIVTKFEPSP